MISRSSVLQNADGRPCCSASTYGSFERQESSQFCSKTQVFYAELEGKSRSRGEEDGGHRAAGAEEAMVGFGVG